MNKIRASMLPAYFDCSRRAAARQFKELIGSAGFELRRMFPSIGAAVGTAVHAELGGALKSKLETGTREINIDVTRAAFREEIADGVEWDATTPNSAVAETQIARMSGAMIVAGVLREETVACELSLEAEIADGWLLTGHIDHLVAAPSGGLHIDDWKTGVLRRPYSPQIGAYSLIAKANGYDVKGASTTYVPRSALKKPQAPAEVVLEILPQVERAAWETTKSIIRDVEKFRETGDPFAFQANPMSLMCSEKYCPAHSTPFCTLHLQKKEKRP